MTESIRLVSLSRPCVIVLIAEHVKVGGGGGGDDVDGEPYFSPLFTSYYGRAQ